MTTINTMYAKNTIYSITKLLRFVTNNKEYLINFNIMDAFIYTKNS